MREPAALRSEEQIRGQLEILQAIATFLSAETPSLVTSSFIIYYRDFGHEDCVEAILETVHLRSDMTPSKLAAWGEAVAIWRKSINRAQGSIKRKNRFDLPHLQERKNEGLVFTTFAAKKELHGSDSKNIDNQTVLPAAVGKKTVESNQPYLTMQIPGSAQQIIAKVGKLATDRFASSASKHKGGVIDKGAAVEDPEICSAAKPVGIVEGNVNSQQSTPRPNTPNGLNLTSLLNMETKSPIVPRRKRLAFFIDLLDSHFNKLMI